MRHAATDHLACAELRHVSRRCAVPRGRAGEDRVTPADQCGDGASADAGVSPRCNDDHRFTDIDGDGAVQNDDVLAPALCRQK